METGTEVVNRINVELERLRGLGTLELVTAYQDAKDDVSCAEQVIFEKLGMDAETFLDGARQLLAPAR